MRARTFPLISILAAIFALPAVSFATPAHLAEFQTAYPNSSAKLQSCTLCHTSPPTRNNYGNDFAANNTTGAAANAFHAIEPLDSDGDGFTNLEEINAGTFPGDPTDKPTSVAATGSGTSTAGAAQSGAGATGASGPISAATAAAGAASGTGNAAVCAQCHTDGRSGTPPAGHPTVGQLVQPAAGSSGAQMASNASVCAQCHSDGRSGTPPAGHPNIGQLSQQQSSSRGGTAHRGGRRYRTERD